MPVLFPHFQRAVMCLDRRRHLPDSLSTASEDMLAGAKWRTVSWRSGTKGRLKARFACCPCAHRRRTFAADMGQQHLPGDEAWLIGEHRVSGRRNTILPTYPPGWTCAAWLRRSRHDGSASRPINSSRRNSVSTISREPAPPHKSEAGKKRFNGPPPQPTLTAVRYAIVDHTSFDQAPRDVRTAEPDRHGKAA